MSMTIDGPLVITCPEDPAEVIEFFQRVDGYKSALKRKEQAQASQERSDVKSISELTLIISIEILEGVARKGLVMRSEFLLELSRKFDKVIAASTSVVFATSFDLAFNFIARYCAVDGENVDDIAERLLEVDKGN